MKGLLADLFRREFGKMVAVISRRYGLQYIEIAEDLVSETFLSAVESWQGKGIPANPEAWLYHVASQKVLLYFRRNKILMDKIVPHMRESQEIYEESAEICFTDGNIKDSQLQMLLAVCHPALGSEAQIGLALRVLCGFSIDEIAQAFFTNKETINKRLFRAKERLRSEGITVEPLGDDDVGTRLDNTLHIIYLLFTEGYYSRTRDEILRRDLCREALRLGLMLTEHKRTDVPKANALVALMCFHASRFDARQAGQENMILYDDQDRSKWNQELIYQGMYFLGRSAVGNEISSYHLEARIACCHCFRDDGEEKWQEVLHLYNQLLLVNYSPAVALNRTYALYKAEGRESALLEAEKLQLSGSHFYHMLLGELYIGVNNNKAMENLRTASTLAGTEAERKHIKRRLEEIIKDGVERRDETVK